MSLKDQRQNRYQGAIQVIRPSNAFSQRKEQEANFFAEMADNFAKDAYDSAVSKGKIKASLAADSYKFTRQLDGKTYYGTVTTGTNAYNGGLRYVSSITECT